MKLVDAFMKSNMTLTSEKQQLSLQRISLLRVSTVLFYTPKGTYKFSYKVKKYALLSNTIYSLHLVRENHRGIKKQVSYAERRSEEEINRWVYEQRRHFLEEDFSKRKYIFKGCVKV